MKISTFVPSFEPIVALRKQSGQLVCARIFGVLGLGILLTTSVMAAPWVPPQSRDEVVFALGDSLAFSPTRWSEDQTKLAARQAVNLLERAIARVRSAESQPDIRFFTGAGDAYVSSEWVYIAAEEVSPAFGLQELGAKNPWIAPYSGCARASKLLADWFHYYRSNLLNNVPMQDLGGDVDLPKLKRQVEASLADCRKGLAS